MTVMRYGCGSMFVWFGMDQWSRPVAWLGWLPGPVNAVTPAPGLLVAAAGVLAFSVGIALIAGLRLRTLSLIAVGLLVAANVSGGVSDATVRDGAACGGLLSIFLHANERHPRPLGTETIAVICTVYILLLLVSGLAFLRAG